MATSVHGISGQTAHQVTVEAGLAQTRRAARKASGGSLFGAPRFEPLVEYPAAIEPPPRYDGMPVAAVRGAIGSSEPRGALALPPTVAMPGTIIEPRGRAGVSEAQHRAVDVALSLALLVLLSPVMLCAMLLVRLSGPGPIIFRQVRIGRDGAPFECLKLRTMEHLAADVLGDLLHASDEIRLEWERDHKIRRDPRVTAIGQVLRRYSIDELPQLINVLRGDMSIVGPRPIVDAEVHRYAEHFSTYCRVRPGLTGLWQVSGRNRLSYERRVELDCHYVATRSLRRDAWIVARTIPAILHGSGC